MAVASGARFLANARSKNNCRLCSRCAPLELPPFVAELLGLGLDPGPGLVGSGGPEPETTRERPPGEAAFQPRSEEEVQEVARKWVPYTHQRADQYFNRAGSEDALLRELAKIARCIDRSSDPILASPSQCVLWHGDQHAGEAIMEVRLPGMTEDTTTFVTRTLAFIFANDQSLACLGPLPRAPLAMNCGNQLCVNLSHITVHMTGAMTADLI